MDLKNIWKHKFSVFNLISILPKKAYKQNIDFDNLLSKNQIFLLRRSNLSFSSTYRKNGSGGYECNEDALVNNPKEAFNLSTNIFGGKFKEKHINFRLSLKHFAGRKWHKGTKICTFKHLSGVTINPPSCSIFIDANKIHRVPRTYSKDLKPNDNILKNYEKITGFNPVMKKKGNKENSYELSGYCKIVHDPLNFNYWHAEYGFYDFDDQRIKKLGAKWIESFYNNLIDNTISINCYPEPFGNNYKINKDTYLD
ncbi:hypothetical protein [Flavobacterium rhizosphaerae]|uniref:Uncharacterized protein n=1 Tax=Flavobacterium rhizosphaerae TaxID=3163298 RepID=A0ABW8Z0X9_9FLAO